MPLTEDSIGSRFGFNCAIGVLDGTIVGDAMVRDCGHIARRVHVMSCVLTLRRAVASIVIGMGSWSRYSSKLNAQGGDADANKDSFLFPDCTFLGHDYTFTLLLMPCV